MAIILNLDAKAFELISLVFVLFSSFASFKVYHPRSTRVLKTLEQNPQTKS
jgi:hypothetical protein